jgi:hypothetical protein
MCNNKILDIKIIFGLLSKNIILGHEGFGSSPKLNQFLGLTKLQPGIIVRHVAWRCTQSWTQEMHVLRAKLSIFLPNLGRNKPFYLGGNKT